MRKIFAVGLLAFGAGIAVFWGVHLASTGLAAFGTSAATAPAHIVIELVTALFCLTAGQTLWANRPQAPVSASFSFGLLAYAGLNNISFLSPGVHPGVMALLVLESAFGFIGMGWLMLAVLSADRKRNRASRRDTQAE